MFHLFPLETECLLWWWLMSSSLRASLGAGNKAAGNISRYFRDISFTDIGHFPRQNICFLSPCVSVSASLSLSFSACLCLSLCTSVFLFLSPLKTSYSLCSSGQLWTHRVLSASVAWVLGLKAYTTTPSTDSLFKRREIDIAVFK